MISITCADVDDSPKVTEIQLAASGINFAGALLVHRHVQIIVEHVSCYAITACVVI